MHHHQLQALEQYADDYPAQNYMPSPIAHSQEYKTQLTNLHQDMNAQDRDLPVRLTRATAKGRGGKRQSHTLMALTEHIRPRVGTEMVTTRSVGRVRSSSSDMRHSTPRWPRPQQRLLRCNQWVRSSPT
eukprot:TRINITY_DN81866_c0_g1_i1.p2 TRINITY_DN81866_c0_g1~~TRINITY_DN81866_c0_g1_i1.p2  ORF type:complete len:129 (-),score=0.31 TRINITY_DN81866_c0_g1_i1:18-404(-)